MKDGLPHAIDINSSGILTFKNGDKQTSKWNDGIPFGMGRIFDANTQKWLVVEWNNEGVLKQTWSRFSGMYSKETHERFLDLLMNTIGPYLPPEKYAKLHLLTESIL